MMMYALFTDGPSNKSFSLYHFMMEWNKNEHRWWAENSEWMKIYERPFSMFFVLWQKNLTKLIKPTIEIKYQDGKLYAYIITFAAFNFQREER